MSKRVITPPDNPTLDDSDPPVVFLGGPIQGAPDWQAKAIELLGDKLIVANPRRAIIDPATFNFEEQVDWETQWLYEAARSGCIVFWLCNQETEHPERVYAQTTRIELGEWVHRSRLEWGRRVVIGIDSNFPGAKYIRYRFRKEAAIFSTLEETVEHACDLAWR